MKLRSVINAAYQAIHDSRPNVNRLAGRAGCSPLTVSVGLDLLSDLVRSMETQFGEMLDSELSTLAPMELPQSRAVAVAPELPAVVGPTVPPHTPEELPPPLTWSKRVRETGGDWTWASAGQPPWYATAFRNGPRWTLTATTDPLRVVDCGNHKTLADCDSWLRGARS